MRRNKPPALGLQLDRCDVCGDKTHRGRLVRTQVEFLELAANNYIIQSSYDDSYWGTNDTAALGAISVGPNADWQRLSLDSDNDLTELRGVETFSTGKRMQSTVASVDTTSWDSMVFSAEVGPYHRSTTPDITVYLEVLQTGATIPVATISTWRINTQTRVWWTLTPEELLAAMTAAFIPLPSLADMVFLIECSGGHWWADRVQLEKNATVPGQFVSTSGSAVDNSTDQTLMTQRKVCPNCVERILSKSERFGKTDESPIDEPVEAWAQEI
jgi:hypothetical protein